MPRARDRRCGTELASKSWVPPSVLAVRQRRSFTPKTWIRYQYGMIALGVITILYEIADGGVSMVYLGIVLILASVMLVGFWRKVGDRESGRDTD